MTISNNTIKQPESKMNVFYFHEMQRMGSEQYQRIEKDAKGFRKRCSRINLGTPLQIFSPSFFTLIGYYIVQFQPAPCKDQTEHKVDAACN
jgi:hypothetical protein